jgi:hypothetical protein
VSTPASIRLSASLHDRIATLADRERRSFSSQAVVLLEEALDGRSAAASVADIARSSEAVAPSSLSGKRSYAPDPKPGRK